MTAQQTERRLNWLAGYEEYLQSAIWREKRRKVLERCRGICEGCAQRRAREIHHERYPRGCEPGSEEWIRREKLYDLVGLCTDCHLDVSFGWERLER
jgi:hypothetical protein